jgi:hypothetical protein
VYRQVGSVVKGVLACASKLERQTTNREEKSFLEVDGAGGAKSNLKKEKRKLS